jgi:hypothetical protein
MKSLQDVVDGFKRLAKHEIQNMKKHVKIVRVTNIVDHIYLYKIIGVHVLDSVICDWLEAPLP